MEDPAQLAAHLDSMHINQDPAARTTAIHTHYLRLRWPASYLIPMGTGHKYIHRATPANIEMRSRPDEQSTHSLTLQDLHVAQLAVQHSPGLFSSAALFQGEARRLLDAVDELRQAKGQSILHMLSYSWYDSRVNIEDREIRYRFRLCPNEDQHSAQDFDLSSEQWEQLTRGSNCESWIALLHDLVARASDVAYFSARKTLIAHYGIDRVIEKEESRYTDQWASSLPRPVEQLFLDRLQPLTREDARRMRGNGDGQIRIRLPCGHQERMRMVQIAAMTAQACFAKTCSRCGTTIIQKEDELEADMALAWQAGHMYKNFNHQWSGYDDSFDNNYHRHHFIGSAIFEAVCRAKESLDMPESICPTAINPTRFVETTKVIDHYQDSFGNSNNSWECTPLEVEQSLFRLAAAALSGDVNDEELYPAGTIFGPPGYAKFLMVWIKRAVNFYLDLNDLDGIVREQRRLEQDMEQIQERMAGVEMDDEMGQAEGVDGVDSTIDDDDHEAEIMV